jgi:hypothetical protein
MIEKLAESSGNILGYKAIGVVKVSDYEKLVPEVESLVEMEGHFRMLLDLGEFKSEEVRAWLPDLKFGLRFRDKIDKMAIVGDKRWEEWMTPLAKPFYARDAKFFHSAEIAKAWAWLRE